MIGIIVLTFTSLLLGIILSLVNYYLNNKENTLQKVVEMLPGFNCNACGFGICKGMAEKAIEDIENLKKCRFLKPEQSKNIIEYIKSHTR